MSCACGQHKTPQGCAGARTLRAMPAEVRRRKPSGRPKASRRTGPLCVCGCGRRCFPEARYASQACVPRSVRSATMREGWARASPQLRAQRFKQDIDRLLARGRITHGELLATLQAVWDRGYAARLACERRAQAS